MKWFLLRWALATLALWATSRLLPNSVELEGAVPAILATAVIGLLNALVKPVLLVIKVITFPLTLATLGLFAILTSFVMNTLVFWLVGRSEWIHGFSVPGFVGALKAALLMSLINGLLTWVVRGAKE